MTIFGPQALKRCSGLLTRRAGSVTLVVHHFIQPQRPGAVRPELLRIQTTNHTPAICLPASSSTIKGRQALKRCTELTSRRTGSVILVAYHHHGSTGILPVCQCRGHSALSTTSGRMPDPPSTGRMPVLRASSIKVMHRSCTPKNGERYPGRPPFIKPSRGSEKGVPSVTSGSPDQQVRFLSSSALATD